MILYLHHSKHLFGHCSFFLWVCQILHPAPNRPTAYCSTAGSELRRNPNGSTIGVPKTNLKPSMIGTDLTDHKVPQQKMQHSWEHLKQRNSNILELHFTRCTFLQIDTAVLWGKFQHLNNPEAWWMTNTTRKLPVQKDILATTHHQDHSVRSHRTAEALTAFTALSPPWHQQ